jgi:hypothetical protein
MMASDGGWWSGMKERVSHRHPQLHVFASNNLSGYFIIKTTAKLFDEESRDRTARHGLTRSGIMPTSS